MHLLFGMKKLNCLICTLLLVILQLPKIKTQSLFISNIWKECNIYQLVQSYSIWIQFHTSTYTCDSPKQLLEYLWAQPPFFIVLHLSIRHVQIPLSIKRASWISISHTLLSDPVMSTPDGLPVIELSHLPMVVTHSSTASIEQEALSDFLVQVHDFHRFSSSAITFEIFSL